MIERYKPRERIPERPEKREHRKERRKRREIVHEWFKYAFLFVKTKRAAIKYVRERKKDREYIEKIEIQEKIREKINAKREKEEKERLERERASEQTSVVDETTGIKKERTKKEAIPKSVRSHVWNLYIGPTINEHRCLCCKKAVIKITEFDCGHVIAESAGGTHEIGNLRPICSACNHAMGSQNMIEFVVKYGYYIG